MEKWTQKEAERREGKQRRNEKEAAIKISHPLFPYPNSSNFPVWVWSKPGARYSILVSHMGSCDQVLGLFSAVFSRVHIRKQLDRK